MSQGLPIYPFESQRRIGSVCEVGPSYVKSNLPKAGLPFGQTYHGEYVGGGEVSEFVVIECGPFGVFGRITRVYLPERERLAVEPKLGSDGKVHPVGSIETFATIELSTGKVAPGLGQQPRLGDSVFSAHPDLVKWLAEACNRSSPSSSPLLLDIAHLPKANNTRVAITPEQLFGRHCAILGATGGGKSWTVAQLIEQCSQHDAKIVLLDATGEFHTLDKRVKHVYIGDRHDKPDTATETVFPHRALNEDDLFAMFCPSVLTQLPVMRAAIKSLKLAEMLDDDHELLLDGRIIKANQEKELYDNEYRTHAEHLNQAGAEFDIHLLPMQMQFECVHLNAFGPKYGDPPDESRWGKVDEGRISNCTPLIARIEGFLHAEECACIFQPDDKESIDDVLSSFMRSRKHSVLRISLKYLPFKYNVREIIANAIGRALLSRARNGDFDDKPLVVFLDEAHQFLNKSLGNEQSRFPLDAFEMIAKEGRKYGITLTLSTQRPRDIPEGVISQVGTLIVHRLTNDRDREVVEKAAGEIDKSATSFLPTLAPGEAVVIGVDFVIPLIMKIDEPTQQPKSAGPDFQKRWKKKVVPAKRRRKRRSRKRD